MRFVVILASIVSMSCISLSGITWLSEMLFGFLLLSSSYIFQSAAVPVRPNAISQHAQSPARFVSL
jgi:hypothetical protein